MHEAENYRPGEVVFTTEEAAVPQSLGKFNTEEDAGRFMAENLLAVPTRYTAMRYMDQVEIEILRDQYTEELEDIIPGLREAYLKSSEELRLAGQKKKQAKKMLKARLAKIQRMADKVNEGTTRMALDLPHTWKVIYNGKKYFYTYIDGEIKLAGTEDVAGYELNDLTGNSKKNKSFFENPQPAVTVGE